MTADDSKDSISRLTDSAETAMYEGDGNCLLRFYSADGSTQLFSFSTKFEADGIKFEDRMTKCFHSIPLSELVPNAKASVK